MDNLEDILIHFVNPSSTTSGTFNDFSTAASDNIASIHKNAILAYDEVMLIEVTPMRAVLFPQQI
jgi:hypothetical protein